MTKKVTKKSASYWSKRMDEIMDYTNRTDIDFFDELQAIYTESRQSVQKEIYAFYAQYAKENKLSLQEAKKRLMREDLSDYRANAEKYFKQVEKDPELLKRLNEQYKAGKVTRLEALQLNLEWELGKMSGTLHQSFARYLKEVAKYAYRKIAGGNSQSTLNKPALEQIIKTPFNGKNYSDSIWGNTDTLAKDLKKVLTQGFVRGSGPDDMARELRKKYNVAKSRAEAIVRTDGTNVINLSAAQRYKDLGLTRYKNNVHVDSRTTDICLQVNRENKSYLLSEYQPGVTAPPYHVGCRTGIVPDNEELGFEETEVNKASRLLNDAKENEPQITKNMKEISNLSKMKLEGLDYRLKSLDSLSRKVDNEPNAKMRDIIRYTAVDSENNMVSEYNKFVAEMVKKGYNISAVKNYWNNSSNPYNGINTNFFSANGYEFEIQFHTRESFALKNGKLHELYEKARIIDDKTAKEYIALQDAMFDLSETLRKPTDIESIKDVK